jgi:hypothetical protein
MKICVKSITGVIAIVALAGIYACSASGPTAVDANAEVALLSVSPAGGATNVKPGAPVTIEFDHPMAQGQEAFCALHEDGLDGPLVLGRWDWSEDHRRLTFTPDHALERGHEYTLHVGGGMQCQHGHPMSFEQHGQALGGSWVEEGMFGPGGGMMGSDHMADGWRHRNGMYGMMFSFSIAP